MRACSIRRRFNSARASDSRMTSSATARLRFARRRRHFLRPLQRRPGVAAGRSAAERDHGDGELHDHQRPAGDAAQRQPAGRLRHSDPEFDSPAIYNFSLGVQRDIGYNTVLDVAYVGSLARHLLATAQHQCRALWCALPAVEH